MSISENILSQNYLEVGIIDLDCFKQKNDTYGHIKGDECLVQVSDILRGVVADIGKAYRFGGDEFVILLNNGTHNQVETMAINAKQKLHEAGIENINSTVIPEITFSQGYVTIYPTRIYTSEELLQYADKALYHVKENGRNVLVSNRAILEAENEAKMEELKKALKVGMKVKGTVISLQKYGAFVDVKGFQALLPISEVSRARIDDL